MQQPQRNDERIVQHYRIELETARRYIEDAGFSVGEVVLVNGEYEAIIAKSPMLFGNVAVDMLPDIYAKFRPGETVHFPVSFCRSLVDIHQLSKALE